MPINFKVNFNHYHNRRYINIYKSAMNTIQLLMTDCTNNHFSNLCYHIMIINNELGRLLQYS